jgi:hypothetical protein
LSAEEDAFDKLFGALPNEGELNEDPTEVFGTESAAG